MKNFRSPCCKFQWKEKPGFLGNCSSMPCGKLPDMDFFPITTNLIIGTTPNEWDYNHLRDLGVRLVINMSFEHRPQFDLYNPPLSFLQLRTIDIPFIPIPVQKLIKGAMAALETIRASGKVYSLCMGGRHRAVEMGAAILVAQERDPHVAMMLIKEHRSFADPFAFYICPRILRFAKDMEEFYRKLTTLQDLTYTVCGSLTLFL